MDSNAATSPNSGVQLRKTTRAKPLNQFWPTETQTSLIHKTLDKENEEKEERKSQHGLRKLKKEGYGGIETRN
ncbi:aminotransferase/sphingosine-1-phosphatase [Corchorus olitorius]|uniref:Aminotransferase/sphingosine-1-phosphatase n=1 Tax=Corchorus olitorius TaxID=93759 RepID=A0A1R3G090_9ROSI|nr:aminotransferase/sphingosine-1-phosphatase [Corchorus olitorius]